jgi:hypothetical protein
LGLHRAQVGSNGVNAAFEGWGNTLLNAYGKTRDAFKSDYALNYLGYVRRHNRDVVGFCRRRCRC